MNLWKRNSWNTQAHPLIHSIHPKPSFFLFFVFILLVPLLIPDERERERD